MTSRMFPIPMQAQGRLWIMPCPRADHLDDDIATYRAAGVTHLVSMLTPEEAQMLGVAEEAAKCQTAGISFHMHSIADFGLPDMDAFTELSHRILDWVNMGHRVAVHCRAGIGRSGMVTAGVLMHHGESAAEAIAQVSAARGVSIPDTAEQGRFLAQFADVLTG